MCCIQNAGVLQDHDNFLYGLILEAWLVSWLFLRVVEALDFISKPQKCVHAQHESLLFFTLTLTSRTENRFKQLHQTLLI